MKHLIIISILIIGVAACKSGKTSSKQKSAPLESTFWKLTELKGKTIMVTPSSGKTIYIQFINTDNKLQGFGGCNGFGGKYELKDGGGITMTNVISTMMACYMLETENQLFEVLRTVDNYNLLDNKLVLNKAKMAPLARFEAIKTIQ